MTKPRTGGPFLAGFLCRCPACGQGPLFQGFLAVTPVCTGCGFALGAADSGDGPAVFVIMIVGFIVVFAALFTEIAIRPPIWLHLVVWLPLATGLCLGLLRPIKGLMIAAQIRNRAARHRRDEVG